MIEHSAWQYALTVRTTHEKKVNIYFNLCAVVVFLVHAVESLVVVIINIIEAQSCRRCSVFFFYKFAALLCVWFCCCCSTVLCPHLFIFLVIELGKISFGFLTFGWQMCTAHTIYRTLLQICCLFRCFAVISI